MEQAPASRPPRRRGEERSKAAPPFDFAQDREPVERLAERQMMPCWWSGSQRILAKYVIWYYYKQIYDLTTSLKVVSLPIFLQW
jgi:hypothetical protein